MRLFVAIEVPKNARGRLEELQREIMPLLPAPEYAEEGRLSATGQIREPRSKWRKTGTNKMHITLQFIGDDIDVHKLPKIEAALQEAKAAAVHIECAGVGAFPSGRNAKVIWAGVQSTGLAQIAKKINGVLAAQGFVPDKPFSAHISIARSKYGQNIQEAINKFDAKVWCEEGWEAQEFELIQSIKSLEGYEYKTLRKYALEKQWLAP